MGKNGKKVLAALMCALICGSSQALANGVNNITIADPNNSMASARLGPTSSNTATNTTTNKWDTKIVNNGNWQKPQDNVIETKLKLAHANPKVDTFPAFRQARLGMKMGYLPMRVWKLNQLTRKNNGGYFQNVEIQSDGMARVNLTLANNYITNTYIRTETISSKLAQVSSIPTKKLTTNTMLYADAAMTKQMFSLPSGTNYKVLEENGTKKLICKFDGVNSATNAVGWVNIAANNNTNNGGSTNVPNNTVVKPKEVLVVLEGNPIKNTFPIYTSLTSGKILRYMSVDECRRVEDNCYFLDIFVHDNGYTSVVYTGPGTNGYKTIYVRTEDISLNGNLARVASLPEKTTAYDMPLYTDANKTKVMYMTGAGRTYKVLGQQGNMVQVYCYGRGVYKAIGWLNMATSISATGFKGDINGDGKVDSDDLNLLDQYTKNSSVAINKADADMNNDGVVDITDYNYLVYYVNPPKPVLKGDVNRDGKVDEADYKLLSQYVTGQKVSGFYHYNADMNDDKKFTSTDLSQLRTKLNSMKPTITDSYTVFNIPNGWYEIAPLANENMRLDVDGARDGNEVVNIKLYNSNGNIAQKFYVNNVGNGYFTLQTGCNGYVDLKYGGTANGSNIWQYEKEAANGHCQKFRAIRHNNDAGVFIEPIAKQGIAIACANNSTSPQTNVVVWSRENNNYQKWRFIQTNSVPVPVDVKEGLYSIQPQCAPNTEITVLGASKTRGTDIVIYSKNSQNQTQKSHQKWQVTKLSNGYYKITAENSGLALNNHNGADTTGNPITLWEYSGFCQEFKFRDAGNGYYIIQPKGTSGVLDVCGGGSANNTKIWLYPYNGTASQKWKLERRTAGRDEPEPYKEWSEWPKRNCDVFENANLTAKKGRVDTADPVTVFEETGSSYHIRYKTNSGGMKEGWVTRDIFKEIPNDLNAKFAEAQRKYPENMNWYKTDPHQHGSQCHGFALLIGTELSGICPQCKWNKITNKSYLDQLKQGDIIRYQKNSARTGNDGKARWRVGHTIIIKQVNGNNIIFTDCNKSGTCDVHWNRVITRTELKKLFLDGDYVRQYPY